MTKRVLAALGLVLAVASPGFAQTVIRVGAFPNITHPQPMVGKANGYFAKAIALTGASLPTGEASLVLPQNTPQQTVAMEVAQGNRQECEIPDSAVSAFDFSQLDAPSRVFHTSTHVNMGAVGFEPT